MQDITGASATELVPTGPDDLVEQLNSAAGRLRMAPWALGVLLLVAAALAPVGIALLLPGVPAVAWLWLRDNAGKSVIAFYAVEDQPARQFEGLIAAIIAVSQLNGAWRLNASGAVGEGYQRKVNAGASNLVSRSALRATMQPPAVLKTNISVPSVEAGTEAIHFLPDRVLVRSGRQFSDMSYDALRVESEQQHFIEHGRVPRDSQQVDMTWQYVNKGGGPDRRFKNNRQLPVMLYGELSLRTASGLNWVVDTSRPEVAHHVAETLRQASSPRQAPLPLGSTP